MKCPLCILVLAVFGCCVSRAPAWSAPRSSGAKCSVRRSPVGCGLRICCRLSGDSYDPRAAPLIPTHGCDQPEGFPRRSAAFACAQRLGAGLSRWQAHRVSGPFATLHGPGPRTCSTGRSEGVIRVSTCNEGKPLLAILGYRLREACGPKSAVETSDPDRAFLTIDSGFPLADLEETMRGGKAFIYPYHVLPGTGLVCAERLGGR